MIAGTEQIETHGPNVVLTWDEAKALDYVRGAIYKSEKHPDKVFLAFRGTIAKTLAADYAVIPKGCDLKQEVLNVEPVCIREEGLECIGFLDFTRLRIRIRGIHD
ncbi:MAG: hypothetical protein ABL985_06520 [Casimicrobium sp.]